MSALKGKRGVVLGVGNPKSIAWFITEKLAELGAEVGLTYLEDPKGRFERNVRKLAEDVGCSLVRPCDVRDDAQVRGLAEEVGARWGGADFVVHSLAFAEQEDLQGAFSSTSREGFLKAQEISAYSLLQLAREFAPGMRSKGGGSFVTLSYIGAVLAVPNYNVMGPAKAALESSVRYLARELGPDNIRVNAISAGPIKTLSAAGIKGFNELSQVVAEHSAMKRNVTREEVAHTAAFLLSRDSSGITGQTVYVDCGYNIMGN